MQRLSSSEVDQQLSLARTSFDSGDLTGAIARIDSLLASNADSAVAHMCKGSILMRLQQPAAALDCFSAALRHEPNNVEALTWATQISLSQRLPDRTDSLARRLIQLEPKNAQAHFWLSVGLCLTGQWLPALEALECALAIEPTRLDYMIGKAQLLAKLRLHSRAIECYRRALEVRAIPHVAVELAELLLEESQIEDAVSLIEEYLPEIPIGARPDALIARAYTESHRFDEAEPYWAAAERSSPDHSGLVAQRATSEISSGRLEVARDLLREVLDSDPNAVQAFGLLAQITKMGRDDLPLIQRMEDLLDANKLPPIPRQSLNYALGKSFHDLGDYERAISSFDRANRLRVEILPPNMRFERAAFKAEIDFQIEFFTGARIASLTKDGLETASPLLIVGMIRSGTTLCEQILSCHSKIRSRGEQSFWGDHRSEFLDPRARRFDSVAGRRLGTEYLRILGSSGQNEVYVVDKNPLNVLLAPALHGIFPNARMLHVMRNAVDNLLSIWMTPMATGLLMISTKEDLVFAYRQYLRLVKHLQDVLPEDRFRTFEYEEITSNPTQTIGAILSYLDLEAEPACLTPEKNLRTVRTPSVYQVRQPINTASQERWRAYEPWLGPFADLLN